MEPESQLSAGGQFPQRRETSLQVRIIGFVMPSIVDYFAIRLIEGV
jgi:hypothetical protein